MCTMLTMDLHGLTSSHRGAQDGHGPRRAALAAAWAAGALELRDVKATLAALPQRAAATLPGVVSPTHSCAGQQEVVT